MNKRFKDGKFYKFVTLEMPRKTLWHHKGHGFTVRYCTSPSKSVPDTIVGRRKRLAREAMKVTRQANRVLANNDDAAYMAFMVGTARVPVPCVGAFMSDWTKASAIARPNKRKSLAWSRKEWLAVKHRDDRFVGEREDAA